MQQIVRSFNTRGLHCMYTRQGLLSHGWGSHRVPARTHTYERITKSQRTWSPIPAETASVVASGTANSQHPHARGDVGCTATHFQTPPHTPRCRGRPRSRRPRHPKQSSKNGDQQSLRCIINALARSLSQPVKKRSALIDGSSTRRWSPSIRRRVTQTQFC